MTDILTGPGVDLASITSPQNWFEGDAQPDLDYPLREYDITSAPNDFNVKTLYGFMESGALKIPGFQRNYVWDIKSSAGAASLVRRSRIST